MGKDQSSQMQLMADMTERNKMDSWHDAAQINVEGPLNTEDTHQMMAGSHMEDNIEELNL